jgi:hypothetical protein
MAGRGAESSAVPRMRRGAAARADMNEVEEVEDIQEVAPTSRKWTKWTQDARAAAPRGARMLFQRKGAALRERRSRLPTGFICKGRTDETLHFNAFAGELRLQGK